MLGPVLLNNSNLDLAIPQICATRGIHTGVPVVIFNHRLKYALAYCIHFYNL